MVGRAEVAEVVAVMVTGLVVVPVPVPVVLSPETELSIALAAARLVVAIVALLQDRHLKTSEEPAHQIQHLPISSSSFLVRLSCDVPDAHYGNDVHVHGCGGVHRSQNKT